MTNDKAKADSESSHDQKQYHKPPDRLLGFPNSKPVRKKGGRKRWKDTKTKKIYEWDYQHGDVEGWDKTGKRHLGSFDPKKGNQVKPPDPSKKPITPTIVKSMNKERYTLAWYSVENESLIGEEDIPLTQDTIRSWFYLSEEDTAIECYDVTASQRRDLMKLVKHKIDLNEFNYQLEGRADKLT
ncbi:hypothetical protein F1728_06620 [Gimesia benthica]|uniref:Uncharacterized protein n=1 Tax=Gimesia benthica TaxID=2608982 RepID=A0A6I6A8I6_9PLAN|nr:colicin E3/pyocin S6 family cytotoxin [Gimesia benthica]QGQ22366.1 hypothetical protein F1728_06620 [Gimesia benthica]